MFPLQSKDPALFVYLSWEARDGNPLLACDQIRQATYLAIMTRLRLQFCHVLSITGTASQVHLVVSFPASLSISTIFRVGQEAAGHAITQWLETYEGRSLETRSLWGRQHTIHTLSLRDAIEACAYFQQQIADSENSASQESTDPPV